MYFPRKEPYKMSNEAKPLNSKMSFDEFKLNSDGMLTVVVQDHKTNEVLMVAYMTKEAYDKTIETGIMTYYSRSRDELWIKGRHPDIISMSKIYILTATEIPYLLR